MNDVMLTPTETPSAVLAAMRGTQPQAPCPVAIRQLTPAEWLIDHHTDGLLVEVRHD